MARSNAEILGPASAHLCVRCGNQAHGWQHRVAQGRGGPTDLFNCVPLCGHGTTGCHGWAEHHPDEAQAIFLDVPGRFVRGRYEGPDPYYRAHYNAERWDEDTGDWLPSVWFVLFCRDCDGDGDPLPIPFATAEERSRWAGAHTRGTGHDRWVVVEQVRPIPMPLVRALAPTEVWR